MEETQSSAPVGLEDDLLGGESLLVVTIWSSITVFHANQKTEWTENFK